MRRRRGVHDHPSRRFSSRRGGSDDVTGHAHALGSCQAGERWMAAKQKIRKAATAKRKWMGSNGSCATWCVVWLGQGCEVGVTVGVLGEFQRVLVGVSC